MFERCLYFNTVALARDVDRIWNEAYSELSLAPSHAYLLRLILAKPGLSPSEIGRELNLEKSTVTRFVDRMVEAGYLVRSAAGKGLGTGQRIFATDRAKAISGRLDAIGEALYRRMTALVGEEDLKQYASLARQVRSRI
ncbi:MAG: MarR family transcriptional regulator [Marinobacter sp.]|uniref:MarR family winged helix-turn-helix transcriptional regulator n=1 Tax=Marinobacter sp. TaxID=50741 RepID=UPI00299D5937|nr:MarR family transcriptional regulator [Marinobacter sp.]MDX1757172.1 MarR family transcriptional regulator [Marinobacter sp.]